MFKYSDTSCEGFKTEEIFKLMQQVQQGRWAAALVSCFYYYYY